MKWWELLLILAMIIIIGTLMFRNTAEASDPYGDSWDLYNFYTDSGNGNRITFKWQNVATSTDYATIDASGMIKDNHLPYPYYRWTTPLADCYASATTTPCYTIFKKLYYYQDGLNLLAENATGLTYSDVSAYLSPTHCIKWAYVNVKYTGGGLISTDHELVGQPFCWGDPDRSPEAPPVYPTLDITSPVDNSTLSEAFDIVGTYSNATSTWKTMVIFEDWDASSTCPVYGSEQYDLERPLYFNYQSLPYFSSAFATSTGTTTIAVSSLPAGNYRCVRCYFINETTGQISDEVCTGYNLVVNVGIPFEPAPEFSYPFANWPDYYASATDKWATSTGLFSSLANAISPLINWVGNLSVSFHNILSTTTAASYGTQFGSAIPVMRGYLVVINNFFNGLPISEIFMFFIVVALMILIYKIIHSFISLIKP